MSKRYGVRSDLTYQGAVRYEKDEKIAAAAARAKRVRCGTREVLRQWRLEVDPGWSPSIHPTVRWNSNGRWGDRRPDAFLQHPRVQELGECTGLGISQTLWRIPVQRDTEEVLVDWLDMTREVDSAHAFLAPCPAPPERRSPGGGQTGTPTLVCHRRRRCPQGARDATARAKGPLNGSGLLQG
jgi:hypothetical protein